MKRATFLRAAVAAAGGLAVAGLTSEASAQPDAGREPLRGGVTYDTGVLHYRDQPLSRARWTRALMEHDLDVIAGRLNCPSVSVFGTEIDRQTATTRAAAERGLTVYVQPRLYDHSQREILDHLAESARQVERLRRQGARIVFAAGCEHILFTPDIVPGANFEERIANIGTLPPQEWPNVANRLNAFLAKAAAVSRQNFGGTVTYGGAFFEPVDWSVFDMVGVDYYEYFGTDAEYRADLAKYRKWNKPLTIMEFGSCTYPGAPQRGGSGYDIVDYEQVPPVIRPGYARDEHAQAGHIARLLRIFAAERIPAHVYTFVNPGAPHSPVREHDMDIASFSVVKTVRDRHDDPYSRYRWEAKESFRALARHNAWRSHSGM
ncbi:abortive phage infection protein [Kibdelosporangium phytohabitans]|uniref:abortive phage infection protein n=1 Tax=Kibdelosporangium phytohabitans TaxID=860235 RepID=UPI000AE24163|nr:abortive phage infection protein [Kibdelosporangium phytohabitans]MBE1463147.1 hypothetical protein [Kibdelosporangium phytohabitans]